MPIKIDFNVDPQILGRAARRSGQIARQERDVDRAREDAKFLATLRERTRSRRETLAFQRRRDVEGQKERAITRGQEQAFRGRQQEFRERVFDEAPGRRLAEQLEQREILRDNFKWEYSQTQKRQFQKLNQARSWIEQQVSEGKWTPQQAEVALRDVEKRFLGILPNEIYDDSPTPQSVFEKSVVKGADGKEYYLDPSGKVTWLGKEEATILATTQNAKAVTEQKEEQAQAKLKADRESDRVKFFIEQGKVKKVVVVGSGENALNEEVPAFTFEEINDRWNQIIGGVQEQQVTQPSVIATEIRSNPQAYLLDRIRDGVDQDTIQEARAIIANPNTTDADLEQLDRLLRG